MMLSKLASALALISTFGSAFGQQGSDYLDPLVAPMTVYEDPIKSPQNMDYDTDKNVFVAHSGWYQDRLVHYYKFRMFTPDTYPGVISPEVTSGAVPLQKIFFVSNTGDFEGVIGKPIIEYHTQDGLDYSDFMVVNFVTAPVGYVEDTFRSVGDIIDSGADVTETNIVLNIPVVPTGSSLQHPIEKGEVTAPISPVPVLYRGVEVWTYVFEVSDQSAADFFASTRSSDVAVQRAKLVTGFEIPVVTAFATPDFVSAIPIYHVNQFSRGVVEGSNGGGPNPAGMRNVIDLDRLDAGYSPLWQIVWATEMPINYMADQLSDADNGTSANGFEWFWAPMYVNCPDIGLLSNDTNSLKEEEFMSTIILDSGKDSFYIMGSFPSLIMQNAIPITFTTDDGTVIGTTKTNMMGGYEHELMKADIPKGTIDILVIDARENETLRTIMVEDMIGENGNSSVAASIRVGSVLFAIWAGTAMFLMA